MGSDFDTSLFSNDTPLCVSFRWFVGTFQLLKIWWKFDIWKWESWVDQWSKWRPLMLRHTGAGSTTIKWVVFFYSFLFFIMLFEFCLYFIFSVFINFVSKFGWIRKFDIFILFFPYFILFFPCLLLCFVKTNQKSKKLWVLP